MIPDCPKCQWDRVVLLAYRHGDARCERCGHEWRWLGNRVTTLFDVFLYLFRDEGNRL